MWIFRNHRSLTLNKNRPKAICISRLSLAGPTMIFRSKLQFRRKSIRNLEHSSGKRYYSFEIIHVSSYFPSIKKLKVGKKLRQPKHCVIKTDGAIFQWWWDRQSFRTDGLNIGARWTGVKSRTRRVTCWRYLVNQNELDTVLIW